MLVVSKRLYLRIWYKVLDFELRYHCERCGTENDMRMKISSFPIVTFLIRPKIRFRDHKKMAHVPLPFVAYDLWEKDHNVKLKNSMERESSYCKIHAYSGSYKILFVHQLSAIKIHLFIYLFILRMAYLRVEYWVARRKLTIWILSLLRLPLSPNLESIKSISNSYNTETDYDILY